MARIMRIQVVCLFGLISCGSPAPSQMEDGTQQVDDFQCLDGMLDVDANDEDVVCHLKRTCTEQLAASGEYATFSESNVELMSAGATPNERGIGIQEFYFAGHATPVISRVTIGGLIAISSDLQVNVEYQRSAFPQEASISISRDGALLAAYFLEPPDVTIPGYLRVLPFEPHMTVAFGGFTGEIVELDDEVEGDCVSYRAACLVVTVGDQDFSVCDGGYLILDDWVITVNAAFQFVEECTPLEFRPNIHYAVFRRTW